MSALTWVVILFSRMVLNLGVRVTYPFLPEIARGLDIPFHQAGLLVAGRHVAGLTAVLWGMLGERRGYVSGMQTGLLLLVVGSAIVWWNNSFVIVLGGFLLLGLAKTAYDPNVQAFVSERVPYSRRARALGILESAWSGSWFLGIPLCGILIAHLGWHGPFAFLCIASLLAVAGTRKSQQLTNSTSSSSSLQPEGGAEEENSTVREVYALVVLGVSLFMVFANENMVIVYGAWLEQTFHMEVEKLGFFSILVGLAELAGECTVVFFVDRIGKKRAILIGLALTGCSYILLPFCQGSVKLALTALVLLFYFFEFTIVSIFPYVSELVPSRRGSWLAYNYSLMVVGRLAGSMVGPYLWDLTQNISYLAVISVAAQVLAIALLLAARRRR
ncbi:MAG: MFS transporter [Deltaproteobacteria bacterium]|nr:MFS transporter [Deltaproteobacteria bacterium]